MLSIHRLSTVAGPVTPTTHSVRNVSLLWWLLLILGAVLALLFALPARGAIVSGEVAIPTSDGGYQPAISYSDPAKVRVEGTSLEANVVATTRYTGTWRTDASINATANGVTKSKTITITPAASASPTSLRFDSVTVRTTSGVLTATLTNRGAAAFAVHSISVTGTYATSYAQSNNCPTNLAAGASCTVGVTFTPLAAATKLAKLSIATGATSTPLSVALSGTGM